MTRGSRHILSRFEKFGKEEDLVRGRAGKVRGENVSRLGAVNRLRNGILPFLPFYGLRFKSIWLKYSNLTLNRKIFQTDRKKRPVMTPFFSKLRRNQISRPSASERAWKNEDSGPRNCPESNKMRRGPVFTGFFNMGAWDHEFYHLKTFIIN